MRDSGMKVARDSPSETCGIGVETLLVGLYDPTKASRITDRNDSYSETNSMSLKIRVSRFEAVVVGLDWWILPMLRSLRTASKLLRRSSVLAGVLAVLGFS